MTDTDPPQKPPLRVALNWPAQPAPPSAGPNWSEASKYQREIAKWIVGGVLATVVTIVAGSSLSQLGALDADHHPQRLVMAIVGASVGLGAIGRFLALSLAVLAVEAGGFSKLGSENTEWKAIATRVNDVFAFELGVDSEAKPRRVQWLVEKRAAGKLNEDERELMRRITASLGFLLVQHRYKRLMEALPIWGTLAVAGLGLFVWAANPPHDGGKPEYVVHLKP